MCPSVQYQDNSGYSELPITLRVYKIRWFILLLYSLMMIFVYIQVVQYVVIADKVSKFYNVSYSYVNITYVIVLLANVLMSVPASYFIDLMGLYKTAVLSAIMIVLSGWIKTFTVHNDRFWLIVVSQLITSIPQTLLTPFPMKLASVWFDANQVSTACSLGMISTTLGEAIGFVIPVIFAKDTSTEDILSCYSFYYAIAATVLGLSVIIFFDEEPPIPPSVSACKQILSAQSEFEHFKQTLVKLLNNKFFMTYAISYSLSLAVKSTLAATVNELILYYHKNADKTVSIVGFLTILVSTLGSFFAARILDKFKVYKPLTYIVHAADVLFTALYFFSTMLDIWVIYLVCVCTGLFGGAVYLIGTQLFLELSYPLSVNVMGCLVSSLMQIISVVAITLYTITFENVGILWSNILAVVLNCLSFLLIFFIKFELFRQESETTPLILRL